VSLDKKDDYSNGITTFDMLLILKHILNIEQFDSPYKYIAADVNRNNSISTADLVAIRKVILGIESTFPTNTSWRFVDANYEFLDNNPLDEDFPETLTINLSNDINLNFVGVKVGDVNGTADNSSPAEGTLVSATERKAQALTFQTTDRNVVAGETYTIPFEAQSANAIIGYQFTMNYSSDVLDFETINTSKTLTAENIAMQDGIIRASWNDIAAVDATTLDFALTFTAKENGRLSELLSIQSNPTKAEAYNEALAILPLALTFIQPEATDFQLYQNNPNPFTGTTLIGFNLPANSAIQLNIFDVTGKALRTIDGQYNKGYNTIDLDVAALNATGVLYYQLHTEFGSLTKKMMVVD